MSLTDTDSKTLKAALERLEADRERIIQEKVERGEAIRAELPLAVLGLPNDEDVELRKAAHIAKLREAGEKREIYFDEDAISVIVTGVPRAGRDDDDQPIANEADNASKSADHWKCPTCGGVFSPEVTIHKCTPPVADPLRSTQI
jgi:hypothetical protein